MACYYARTKVLEIIIVNGGTGAKLQMISANNNAPLKLPIVFFFKTFIIQLHQAIDNYCR